MKTPDIYHSAFKEEIKGLKELYYFKNNNSIVLQHDLNNGINEIFKNCDCIYSEPAWKNGYELFLKRSNKDSKSYKEYLKSIENVISDLKKPTFLIGGKHMLKYINPTNIVDIRFNGFYAILMIWFSDKIEVKTNYDVIEVLINNYKNVLDFSCGYGNHLKNFKNFIASDINPKCVYYIAKNLMNYKEEL